MNAEDRSQALEAILRRLCLVVEQVKCCVIVTQDGLPIAGYPAEVDQIGLGRPIENRELAALAASLTGAGERTMHRLAQGKPGRLVLEGEAGTMLSFPLGEVSLAVLVASDANLAQVLFAAQKAAEEIESVLSPV